MVAPQHPTRGYFYLAWGAGSFFDEAIGSVRSLKHHTPNAQVTIAVADAAPEMLARLRREFDDVLEIPAVTGEERQRPAHARDVSFKVRTLAEHSPYEQTFYIDTDTLFLDSADELFDLLEFLDLAIAPSPDDLVPARTNDGRAFRSFLPYDTGLIVFNRSRVQALFADWLRRYQEGPGGADLQVQLSDQPAFASALLESDVRFAVLQTIWNARLGRPERFPDDVKVIHARPKDLRGLSLAAAARRVNRPGQARVWVPQINEVVTFNLGLFRWGIVIARGLSALLGSKLSRARARVGWSPARTGRS